MNQNTETDVEGGSPRESVVSASASVPKVSAPTAQEPQRFDPAIRHTGLFTPDIPMLVKATGGKVVLFTDYERTAAALRELEEEVKTMLPVKFEGETMLPCPFCGTSHHLTVERREVQWFYNEGKHTSFVVACGNCGAQGRPFGHMSMHTPKVAIGYWNSRTPLPATALAAAQERIRQLEEDRDKLREFAQRVMKAWPEGGIEGGDLQDTAEECEILHPVTATGPCGDGCECQFFTDFPTTCYRKTQLLTGAPSTPSAAEREEEP